jgi:hypothetical protein
VSNTQTRRDLCLSWRRALDLAAPRFRDIQKAPQSAGENLVLTEAQLQAMEKTKEQREAHGEIETEHPGYLGAQDTYYVGTIKGIGRIYQQTFIDTYAKVGFGKLFTSKHAITAADLLNYQVLP